MMDLENYAAVTYLRF